MSFSFRIRFKLPARIRIGIDLHTWLLSEVNMIPEITLRSMNSKTTISSSIDLVFRGDGYNSENEASLAAEEFKDAITITFSKLRIGADFGERAPKSAFTNIGLKMLENDSGYQRVLNDVHGTMLFETEPLTRFANLQADALLTKGKDDFINTLEETVKLHNKLLPENRLAFELFSASFFQPSADARLLMLMMGVETLIRPKPRSDLARKHVLQLIQLTNDSKILDKKEKKSLTGTLIWLVNESINQTGRKLAARLGTHKYLNMNPVSFFSYCYDIRSKLVHGSVPRPSRDEVDIAAVNLEAFLGDILAGSFFDEVLPLPLAQE